MAGGFRRFVFTWLLLTASGTFTSGQDDGITEVTTPEGSPTSLNQVTASEESSSYTNLTILSTDATTPTTVEGKTQTATTPADSPSSWRDTLTIGITATAESAVTESTTLDGTTDAGTTDAAEYKMGTTTLSSTTRSLDTRNTSAVVFTTGQTPDASTQESRITSTVNTSMTPEEEKSHGTTRVTGGGGGLTGSTALDRSSAATAIIPITKPKKKTDTAQDKSKPNAGTNHSKAVAGLIGGALLLMMVGFLVIYFKKRKLQKQKITTTDWAGPSPFLESGSNNGNGALRSSNRISLSSFLPQRLSKRLSLLPETDEEMEDMTPTTFAGKHSENSNGQTLDGNGAQERNGSALVVPDVKSTGDSNEVGKTSSESTNNNSEVTSLNQDQSDKVPVQSEVGEKSSSTN